MKAKLGLKNITEFLISLIALERIMLFDILWPKWPKSIVDPCTYRANRLILCLSRFSYTFSSI